MNEASQAAFVNAIQNNSAFLARQEIEKLKESHRSDPDRLEQYGYKVYSQADEDGILAEIFKRLGIEQGTFAEIGVENGLECNTLFLIHKGWRGIWLEGNPAQLGPIQSTFSSILENKRLGAIIGYVTPDNINQNIQFMCSHINIKINDIDFLSIDVDGMDIYLFEAQQFNPKVICIEYNAKFPPPVFKKPVFDENYSWGHNDYMGSSLVAIVESAALKGYSLVGTNLLGSNAFFVRDDLVGDLFSRNRTAENLYNPPRYYLLNHYLSGVGHSASFGPYTDLT